MPKTITIEIPVEETAEAEINRMLNEVRMATERIRASQDRTEQNQNRTQQLLESLPEFRRR